MNLLREYTPYVLEFTADYDNPWDLTDQLSELLKAESASLGDEYERRGGCYVHKSAIVHPTAILQDVAIVHAHASIGPHVMLRAGVWVGEGAHIGGSSEVKQSIIGPKSAVAHLNYVGNSVLGEDVNIEAGAVLAVHFNERADNSILVLIDGKKKQTGVKKFGALLGDGSRIGANAVTTPGTILKPGSVVRRLELVEQIPESEI